jgi:hypothetical protein
MESLDVHHLLLQVMMSATTHDMFVMMFCVD